MFLKTLEEADNYNKDRKEVIIYKADGINCRLINRNLINLQQLFGNDRLSGLYAECFSNWINIFKDFTPCLCIGSINGDTMTDSEALNTLTEYNSRMHDLSDVENGVKATMDKGGYIKNDIIYLLEIHRRDLKNPNLYNEVAEFKRKKLKEMKKADDEYRVKVAETIRRQEEEAKAETERLRQQKLDFLMGYGDGKKPIQIERLYAFLSKEICYRENGKILHKTRRNFVTDAISEGGRVDIIKNETHYYGSKWDVKKTKPKTVYRLICANGAFWNITKIEYDFGKYIMSKQEERE